MSWFLCMVWDSEWSSFFVCCFFFFFFFGQSTFPRFISETFLTRHSPHFAPRCLQSWRPARWWCDVCPIPRLGGSPACLKDGVFQWCVSFFFLSLKNRAYWRRAFADNTCAHLHSGWSFKWKRKGGISPGPQGVTVADKGLCPSRGCHLSPVTEWKEEGGRGQAAWCAVWNSFSLSAETFFFCKSSSSRPMLLWMGLFTQQCLSYRAVPRVIIRPVQRTSVSFHCF